MWSHRFQLAICCSHQLQTPKWLWWPALVIAATPVACPLPQSNRPCQLHTSQRPLTKACRSWWAMHASCIGMARLIWPQCFLPTPKAHSGHAGHTPGLLARRLHISQALAQPCLPSFMTESAVHPSSVVTQQEADLDPYRLQWSPGRPVNQPASTASIMAHPDPTINRDMPPSSPTAQ